MAKPTRVKKSEKLERPVFLKIENYLGKYPFEDRANKIEELIEAAGFLVACARNNNLEHVLALDPLYYHEIRRFYNAWKVECRKFFKNNLAHFRNEYEIFSESDSIPLDLYINNEVDQVRNPASDKILDDIAAETRAKLPLLRNARDRINSLYPAELKAGGINEITIVIPPDQDEKYTLIINKVYGKPYRFSRKKMSSGKLLFDLSDIEEVACDEYNGQSEKYWNSSKVNPIYKTGGYALTKLIGEKDSYYNRNVKITRVTRETYRKLCLKSEVK